MQIFPKSSYPPLSSLCQEEVSLEHIAYDDNLVAEGGPLIRGDWDFLRYAW